MPSQESCQARSPLQARGQTEAPYRNFLPYLSRPPWVSLPTISVAPSVPLDVPPDVPLDVPLDVPAGMVDRTPSRFKFPAELPPPTAPPPNEQPVAEGDGLRVQVSIYPLIRSSTPQSHHFALITALGMLTRFSEPWNLLRSSETRFRLHIQPQL